MYPQDAFTKGQNLPGVSTLVTDLGNGLYQVILRIVRAGSYEARVCLGDALVKNGVVKFEVRGVEMEEM